MASPSTSTGSRPSMNPGKLRVLLEMIKWEHTAFALPFAYAGMLAAPVPFSFSNLFWITVAMIGARTAGMTLNRIIDAGIDARNPRTADRAIPKGLIGVKEAWVFTVAAIALLILATFFLAPITRILWPLVVLGFVVYPYTKRFTWLCHLALGAANGLAPGAAWVAVTGEISWTPVFIWAGAALWVAGFDVIYALLDRDFDLENRVNSLPARFGIGAALVVSRVWHVLSVAFLVAFEHRVHERRDRLPVLQRLHQRLRKLLRHRAVRSGFMPRDDDCAQQRCGHRRHQHLTECLLLR